MLLWYLTMRLILKTTKKNKNIKKGKKIQIIAPFKYNLHQKINLINPF